MVPARSENQTNVRTRNKTQGLSGRTLLWVLIAMFIIVMLMFLFGGDGLWNTIALSRRVAKLEVKVDSLVSINEKMAERIEGLTKDDLRVIEEEAREHGLIKPGEKVYLMRSKKDDTR